MPAGVPWCRTLIWDTSTTGRKSSTCSQTPLYCRAGKSPARDFSVCVCKHGGRELGQRSPICICRVQGNPIPREFSLSISASGGGREADGGQVVGGGRQMSHFHLCACKGFSCLQTWMWEGGDLIIPSLHLQMCMGKSLCKGFSWECLQLKSGRMSHRIMPAPFLQLVIRSAARNSCWVIK